jgi:hypothetical protein
MERKCPPGTTNDPSSWATNDGVHKNGSDRESNAINGTPKQQNSACYPTPTPTMTPTATPTAEPIAEGEVLFNEIAWMGTQCSAYDEWIELYNTTDGAIDLTGSIIQVVTVATDPVTIATLSGTIAAGGYYLIENPDGATTSAVEDLAVNFPQVLSNDGEDLELVSGSTVVDLVYAARMGGWYAGTASPLYASMEKIYPTLPSSCPYSWATYNCTPTATDECDLDLYGTPGAVNCVTVCVSSGPVIINEVAWMGTECSGYDEWIELYNISEDPVDIASWSIYGIKSGACLNISDFAVATGESTVIAAGDYLVLGNSFDIFNSGATVHLATSAVQLTNTGGQIILYDAVDCAGNVVDIAGTGGEWPAGKGNPDYIAMERVFPELCGDNAYNWVDFDGMPIASDACDLDVNGSPGAGYIVCSFAYSGPVVINEVAWMGTDALATDEWIELHNITDSPVDIADWSIWGLQDGACLNISSFDVNPAGHGTTIPAHGYLILGDNFTIFASGAIVDLANSDVDLHNPHGLIILYDTTGCPWPNHVVDIANNGGPWFAGKAPPPRCITMERIFPQVPGWLWWNWHDFIGVPFATDRNGGDVYGSPRQINSVTPFGAP